MTNDGATILKSVWIDNPAARTNTTMSDEVHDEVHDDDDDDDDDDDQPRDNITHVQWHRSSH